MSDELTGKTLKHAIGDRVFVQSRGEFGEVLEVARFENVYQYFVGTNGAMLWYSEQHLTVIPDELAALREQVATLTAERDALRQLLIAEAGDVTHIMSADYVAKLVNGGLVVLTYEEFIEETPDDD